MKIRACVSLSLFLLAAATISHAQTGNRYLQGLIDAEKSFARTAQEKGIREAFLAYLANDSIVFRPKPVPGRKVYEELPAESPIQLTWNPAYAEVSLAGDLGFTTGPYEAKDKSKPNQPASYGHYVSVWERQANREWKVSLDAGVRHPQPVPVPSAVATRPDSIKGWRGPRVDRDMERAELLNVERAFIDKAAAAGPTEAYLQHAAEDVRLYRDNSLPLSGKAALLKKLSGDSGRLKWEPVDAVVSSIGDLGYVFGSAETVSGAEKPVESSSYLRIWRKTAGGEWRIVLDLAVPVPGPKQPG
jgi:ketosteroid isomerase-like protein